VNDALKSASDALSPAMIGVAIAVVLIALVRLLLPPAKKRLAREPIAFLAIHIFARAVLLLADPASITGRSASLVATVLLFASVGRSLVLIALEGVVARSRLTGPLPRIFRDIIQALVYVILLLIALRTAGVDPGSILTTSALLTAAIALSMQETLGNLFAGLAIQMQRPFDVDDWIQFDTDPKRIGRVLEINWRATKVLTLDDVEVIVPNATLAKVPIINFTKPTTSSRRSIYLQAPPDVAPHIVREAILKGLAESEGILDVPAPSVVVSDFQGGNLEYWVRFHTDRFEMRDQIDSTARERIWYALTRAGVQPGYPNRKVRLHEVSAQTEAQEEDRQLARRESALDAVDFMRVLTTEQRRQLARSSRIHIYGGDEPIVRQGEKSAEMFIVQSGEVIVESDSTTNGGNGGNSNGNGHGHGHGHGPGAGRHLAIEVARLGPGEFFGEMALMTGEHRTATVRATKPSTLIGVEQTAVKNLLEASPELAAIISRVIAERQAAREAKMSASQPDGVNVEERSSQLLGRIRKFFAI
jgi:small-conductance mechanosensitive channel/CRP-like cAMP-binding protein